ncbi:MAG: choice-of-anchor D domain-containing protein [Acidobacteriota bacterium]
MRRLFSAIALLAVFICAASRLEAAPLRQTIQSNPQINDSSSAANEDRKKNLNPADGPAAAEDKDKTGNNPSTKPAPTTKAPQSLAQLPMTQSLRIQAKGLTIRYPENWTKVESRFANAQELHSLKEGAKSARIIITSEQRRDHADALRRLREIAAEQDVKTSYIEIGGWPALQRRYTEDVPMPGKRAQGLGPVAHLVKVTTAIAADDLLVRIDATIPSERSAELADQVEGIGQAALLDRKGIPGQVEQEIQTLRSQPSLRSELTAKPPANPLLPVEQTKEQIPSPTERGLVPFSSVAKSEDQAGASLRVGNGSEIEITASQNGRNIVVASNGGFTFSNNGGANFFGRCLNSGGGGSSNVCDTVNPTCPASETCQNRRVTFPAGFNRLNGDPSLATGQSGTFYYALIGFPTATSNSTAIFASTDNGQTFNFRNNSITCGGQVVPGAAGPGLCFADQEHIAADRFNAAPGGDQVYATWRDFDGVDQDPGLVCSANGGTTWTPRIIVGAGAFPRITVGQNGFVYVAYFSGGNYMLHKFSSCATGLTPQPGFPVAVAARSGTVCPFAGHDRCDQNPQSQTVAVDDTNPNHIYFAYAENSSANNDNIIVRDSLNGGATWPAARSVRANATVDGKRIMPWVCTTGGEAFVSWYDRRAATPCPAPPCVANNDLTDYFGGRVGIDFSGTLVSRGDFKVSDAADPWCASGWGSGTRATNSAESCSVQPQLAGFCCVLDAMGNCTAGSSNNRCDFSATPGVGTAPCLAGETCSTGGGGPKYGDYSGSACIAGRLLTAWASATSPPTGPAISGIDTFFSARIVGAVPQIQVPAPPNFASACVGTMGKATLNVCNTGNSNLEVSSISSSNARFTVTSPSAGFPVIVSPDFCFPFQVAFMPTATGGQNASFTINTNDPVNPSLLINATAQGEQPRIATIVADSGNFGDVCVGKFKDLKITVNNSGGCDLVINGITSSSSQFQTAGVMSFPLVIHPGDSIEIPIRFEPTSFGMKSGTITINSNDTLSPAKAVSVNGNAPSATIVVNDPITFDKTCPGNTNNKTLTIGNSGGCDLIVTGITSSSPEFKVVGVVPFPIVIPPGSTRDITIQFMPMGFTVDPMRMAILTIMSNDLATPNKMVKVIGIVPPPIIQAMPDPLDFGKVCLGKSKELPLTITNTGECNLTVSGISFSSTEFKLVSPPAFPFVIPPGGSRVVMVSFMPVGMTGARMATMAINSDDPATPLKVVTLKGEAPVSDILVTGDFDWGGVFVGQSKTQVLNITNTAECDLAITLVCEVKNGIPQLPSIEFKVENILNYPVVIPAGKTLPVFVRFKPSKKGPREATFVVFGYDPQTAALLLTRSYPLKGNGK